MRATTLIRSAAAAALVAAMLVAPATTAPAADDGQEYCDPSYPGNGTYDSLPLGGPAVISGTISGDDGGPWEVLVESDGNKRTASQTTGPGGTFRFEIPGGGFHFLVIDGRWKGLVRENTPQSIVLPPVTDVTVTTLDPALGTPVEGARVLVLDLGVFFGTDDFRYITDEAPGLIQGYTGPSGRVVLTGIPDQRGQLGGQQLTLVACINGVIDISFARLEGLEGSGGPSLTMPGDADGVWGALEDSYDRDGDGRPDGDGNSDGIRDSTQSNVATLPSRVNGSEGPYLTVEAPAGGTLRNVTTSDPPGPPPPGTTLPFGLVGFRLTGVTPGSTNDVTIYLPSVAGVTGYLKSLPADPFWGPMPSNRVDVDPARNAITLTLTDGGIGDGDGQANGVIDDPGGPYSGNALPGGDFNADGIPDSLQPPGTPEFEFRDTSTTPETSGRLVDSNGLTGRVTDAADLTKGVLVTVDPRVDGTGSGPAELEVCGSTVLVEPGSQVVLTCASIIVEPITGSATVVLDNGDTVTVPAGASAEIEDTTDGVTLTNVSGGVTVTVNGDTFTAPIGAGPVTYPLPDNGGSLRGAEGYAFGTFVREPTSFCNADGSGEIRYSATNPLSGEYGGTMTTEAVVTLGPRTSGDLSPISGLSGTFTITGGLERISGTLALAPARQYTPGGTADFMNQAYCDGAYFQVTGRFDAIGDNGFSEQGFVKLAGSYARSLNPSNLSTAEFWVAPEISIQPEGEVDEAGVQGNPSSPPVDVGGYPFAIRVFPAPIDDLEVRFATADDSAVAGDDYLAVDTVLQIDGIAQPEYSGNTRVVVDLNDDGAAEPVEEFDAAIELVSGAAFAGSQMSATARIFDDDGPAASIADVSLAEGDSGDYPDLGLVIKAPQPVAAPVYACLVPSGGTAMPDVGPTETDYYPYVGGCRTTTGADGASAILNTGELESPISAGFVSGDAIAEPDETIEWTIDWIWGAPLPADPAVTVTILDDDDADADGDGVADAIGAGASGSWDDDGDPTPETGTYGRILSGTGVFIEDADDPDEGVRITTTTEPVQLEMCTPVRNVTQAAGTVSTETCGSVTARVESGPGVTIHLGPDTRVTVPNGVTVKVDEAVNGGDTIEVLSSEDPAGTVTLTSGSETREIGLDEGEVTARAWTFAGFTQPVDNNGVVNVIKGGQTVPLKWRITEAGVPVTDLTSARVTFKAGCESQSSLDSIEETVADSGFKNLGNGYYQFNWKTPRKPGVCGTMLLDIGDGVLHPAVFRLK